VSPTAEAEALDVVAHLFRRRASLQRRLAAVEANAVQAIDAARAAGVEWDELAGAAGMTSAPGVIQWRRRNSRAVSGDMTCEFCGGPFARVAKMGPTPRFCSGACRTAAHRARHARSDQAGA
jgi:ferredoxin